MGAGKRNVVVGFLVLSLAMLLGTSIQIKKMIGSAPKEAAEAEEDEELGEHGDMPGHLLGIIHAHTSIFAVLNILIGLVIGRTGLGDRGKKAASVLGFVAVILFPLGLLLILVSGVEQLGIVTMLGGLCMIGAAATTFVGALKAPAEA